MAWTKRATKKYGWTYAGLDAYLHDVWMYAAKKKGTISADAIVEPLRWWIQTGRASLAECKALTEKRPYRVGQILMTGGSVDEAVARIREYIQK